MNKNFLSKKSWHTGSLKHIEKVWKAEQRDIDEKKKVELLKRELAEENKQYDLKKMAEVASGKPQVDKVDWLYAIKKGPSAEEFLTGNSTLRLREEERELEQLAKKPGSLWNTQVNAKYDQQQKVRDDPMLLIKQQEQKALKKILDNPMQMKKIKESKSVRKMLKKLKKMEKKRKRKEKGSSSSSSEEEDKPQDRMEDIAKEVDDNHSVRMEDIQPPALKKEPGKEDIDRKDERDCDLDKYRSRRDDRDRDRDRERERERERRDRDRERERRDRDRDREDRDRDRERERRDRDRDREDKDRSDERERRDEKERDRRDERERERREDRDRERRRDREPAKPRLTEEERKRRLEEMQRDAMILEEMKWKKLKTATEEESKIGIDSTTNTRSSFIDDMNRNIYSQSNETLEDRVHRNIHTTKRSTGTALVHEEGGL